MVNGDPQRTVRPNVTAGTTIRGGMLLIGTAVLAGVVGWSSDIPAALVLIGGVLTALAGVGVTYFNLDSREYRFYSDEVEVYEGFINIKQNNTSYDRITDISFSQPITQRVFGTGTVKLNTAGSAYHEIKISYVDSPEQEYTTLKQIIGETR